MRFENVYFINGTAYAGKSTLVKGLAEKYNGIACEENYHNAMLDELDSREFPCLTYTRDLKDWHDFVRRTPDEYEAWILGVTKECEILELRMLEEISRRGKPVFVDTNICPETLHKVAAPGHVLIMLAEPEISVKLFFDRPDREKQFLYRLLMEEENPEAALENFRRCLARINSPENHAAFLSSGFPVLHRDEKRSIAQTLALAEVCLGLTSANDVV